MDLIAPGIPIAAIAATEIPLNPRLSSSALLLLRPEGGVTVRWGRDALALPPGPFSAALQAVAPHLSGHHSLSVLSALSGQDEDILMFSLKVLQTRRLLDSGPPPPQSTAPAEQRMLRWLSAVTDAPAAAWARLRAGHVLLLGEGPLAAALREALAEVGIQVAEGAGDWSAAALVIAAEDAPHAGTLLAANQQGLARGQRWLPVSLQGTEGRLGPLVLPGAGPCEECVRRRAAAHDPEPTTALLYQDALARQAIDSGVLSPHLRALAGLAALEVVRLLSGALPATTLSTAIVLDGRVGQTAQHPILRLPACPACGPLHTQPSPETLRQLLRRA